jgi:hypothetical protein
MGGILKPEFVEERRIALEKYLCDVVEDPNAASSADFRAFMDANRFLDVSKLRRAVPLRLQSLQIAACGGVAP